MRRIVSIGLGIVLGFALFVVPDQLGLLSESVGLVARIVLGLLLLCTGFFHSGRGRRGVWSGLGYGAGGSLLLLTGLNYLIRARELGVL